MYVDQMMAEDHRYCPNCRAEYRAGFELCSDCDEQLEDGLPPADVTGPSRKRSPWILVILLAVILVIGRLVSAIFGLATGSDTVGIVVLLTSLFLAAVVVVLWARYDTRE